MRLKDEREKRRREKNDEIIERMRKGENLCQFDKVESNFPLRKLIEKDKKSIKKLYDLEEE